jgi:hypothetical protein
VIDGGVLSSIQLNVLDVVAVPFVLSVAVNVLVCEREQPSLLILPSIDVTVGVPQLSEADAEPNAAFIADADGLHPNDVVVPDADISGSVLSNVSIKSSVPSQPPAPSAVNVKVTVPAVISVAEGV